MASNRLATLGILVDPSGALIGTAMVDKALLKTAAVSKATTTSMAVGWKSLRGMLAGAAGAVAGIGAGFTAVSALSEFAKFEQGMRNVAAVSGSTAAELRLLEEAALDMAIATRYNPEQTTQALYALASQGLKTADSLKVLPHILALAEAGQGDLAKTTELMVSTMAQFNLEADQAQRVADVLTAAIGASATNIHRLQIGMAAAGPASNALNQSFENTVATVAMLTTVLGNGEMAGTGLKTILGQLAVEAKAMGLSVFNSGDEMQDLILTLEQMGTIGVTVQEVWKRLGLRGGPAMSALLNAGIGSMQDMRDAIKANGQSAKIASMQLDTLRGDIDQLGSSADVFQVRFGRMLGEPARKAVQAVTKWIRELTWALPDAANEAELFGNRWGLLLGQLLEKGGLLRLMFDGLRIMLGWVGDAAVYMYEKIRDFPINFMADVQLVAATFKYAWGLMSTANYGFVDSMLEGWTQLKQDMELIMYDLGYAWDALIVGMKNKMSEWLDSLAGNMEKYGGGFFDDTAATIRTAAILMKESKPAYDEYSQGIIKLREEHKKENAELAAKIETRKTDRKTAKSNFVNEIDEILAVRKEMLISTDTGVAGIEEIIVTAKKRGKAEKDVGKIIKEVNTHSMAFAHRTAEVTLDVIDKIMEMVEFAKKEWKRIMEDVEFGNISELLALAIENGFKTGIKDGMSFFKKAWEGFDGEPRDRFGLITGGIAALAGGITTFKDAPNAAHGLVDVAGMIPIPQVQAAVAALNALDELFEGKLLGTDWKVIRSEMNIDASAAGFTGDITSRERKEKFLFLGSKKRDVTRDLDQAVQDQLEEAFNNMLNTVSRIAHEFGVSMGDLITGEFIKTFDKDGNVTKEMSTVMGREWSESLEDFTRRVMAENILAVIGATTGSSPSTRTLTDKEILDRSGFVAGRQGAGDRGTARDEADMRDIIRASRASGGDQLTEVMSEVSIIAERWRHDAQLLLEGAQLIAEAQSDIMGGFNILTDGSLTDVINLTEDLAFAGEALADTYNRVKEDTKNLETAMRITGVNLDLTREEFVRFAVDIEAAAGGLERATALWQSFFDNYFTEQERAATELSFIADEINTLYGTIGRSDVTFANFRAQFEEAMPTLTPEQVASWLELGDALYRASELFGEGGLVEAINRYMEGAAASTETTLTLADALNLTQGYLNDAIAAYDGSAVSQVALTAAINDRYTAELAYLNMIEISVATVQGIIDNAITSIKIDQMTDEEHYAFLKAKADELAASISGLTDPEEVAAVVEEINRLQTAAYGLLDETQREKMADGFILFLQDVGILAEAKLEELREAIELEQLDNNDKLGLVLDRFSESQGESVSQIESSARTMGSAANTFAGAVSEFVSTPIVVQVVGGRGFEAN